MRFSKYTRIIKVEKLELSSYIIECEKMSNGEHVSLSGEKRQDEHSLTHSQATKEASCQS
jgi:hypothetical protein